MDASAVKEDRTIRACSIWRALDVVGDVPVLLIMEQAFLGTHGFDEFVARTGLARSVVSGRLRKLVDEDCLAKRPKKEGRGIEAIPFGPPEKSVQFTRMTRMISPKPSVTMAR